MSSDKNTGTFRSEIEQQTTESFVGRVFIHTPLGAQWLIIFLTVSVVAIIVFLATGNYARRELVPGYLAIESEVAKVFSPQPGVVRELHVTDGETVTKGQRLVTISNARYTEQGSSVGELQAHELTKQQDELTKQIQAEHDRFTLELRHLELSIKRTQETLANIEQQIDNENKRIQLFDAQYDRLETLQLSGDVPIVKLEAADERRIEANLRLTQLEGRVIEVQSERDRFEYQREQLPINKRQTMSELEVRRRDVTQRLTESTSNASFTLRAPRAGLITALQTTTGRQVNQQTPLLVVVPSSSPFYANLLVPSNAIGFVRQGQAVNLLYNAFPYQKYGSFPGIVEDVGRTVLMPNELGSPLDVKKPMYRVRVRLQHQTISAYGEEHPLQLDMLLQASILIDDRTLLQWLLDPIYTVTRR